MAKCSNCSKEALYEYKVTAKVSVLYCDKDLPRFLHARRDAGTLGITSVLSENLDSALKTLSGTDASEPSSDDSTATKKAPKKKAE